MVFIFGQCLFSASVFFFASYVDVSAHLRLRSLALLLVLSLCCVSAAANVGLVLGALSGCSPNSPTGVVKLINRRQRRGVFHRSVGALGKAFHSFLRVFELPAKSSGSDPIFGEQGGLAGGSGAGVGDFLMFYSALVPLLLVCFRAVVAFLPVFSPADCCFCFPPALTKRVHSNFDKLQLMEILHVEASFLFHF